MGDLGDLRRAVEVPEARIARALLRLHQGIESAVRRLGTAERLSPTQVEVLLFLSQAHADYRGVNAIAKRFSIAPATASRVIDNLENKRLVRRARDVGDRRRVHLELTPAGRQAVKKIVAPASRLENYVKQLSPEDLETFGRGLEHILHSLHEDGYLTVSSTCRTCSHFRKNVYPKAGRPHLCRRKGQRMSERESYLERLGETALC